MDQGRAIRHDSPLNDYRRKMIVAKLAFGTPRTEIAKALGVHQSTLRAWIRSDPQLKEQADKMRVELYERALEEHEAMAFGKAELTSPVKMQALLRIINSYEDDQRRLAGEITVDGVHLLMMQVCAILVDMPDAKQKVIHAYRDARNQIDDAASGSGDVPRGDAGEKPADS